MAKTLEFETAQKGETNMKEPMTYNEKIAAYGRWEVIVGNIGYVYEDYNAFWANSCFNTYVGQSKRNEGRAAGESVTLMCDGEIMK